MAKKTEVTTLQLQPELMKIAESSGMQLTEAQSIGAVFAPFMSKVNDLTEQINAIQSTDPSTEDAALARKLRLELVSNRGKNGILQAHTDLKAGILIRGRLIDSYKNVVEDSSKIAEMHAESIEKHSERKEAVRLDAVEALRVEALKPYGTNTEFVNIRLMDDDTFTRFLANEKLLFEAHQEELRKAEELRIQAEKDAEIERLERERVALEEQKKRDTELAELKRKEKERETELAAIRAEQAKKDEAVRKLQAAKDKEIADLKAKQDAAALKVKQEQEAKQEKERQAALAPDQDKLKAWFEELKVLQSKVPTFKSKEGATVSAAIIKGFTKLRSDIATAAKVLK